MAAVLVQKPYVIAIKDHPTPPPGQGEVTIRFLQGGLCGSDLTAYQGLSPLVVYPRILGHELVGEVVHSGTDTDDWLGSKVVLEPMVACGTCIACRQGRYNTCVRLRVMGVHIDGGFQHYFTVPVANLHRLPEGIDLDTAVLAEPLAVASHAVFRAKVNKSEKVIIMGAGPIGLLALQVVSSYLGASALVVDIRPERLALAELLGAGKTVSLAGWSGPGTSPTLIEAVQDWTAGDMAQAAIEATGHAASTGAAIDCLAHTGRLSLVGWNKAPITVDTVLLMRKELDVYGSRNSCGMFPRVLQMLAEGHINAQAVITHRFRLHEAEAALRLMADPQVPSLKVLLQP